MIVTRPDGTIEVYDDSGKVRLRLGDLSKGTIMAEMYHMTKDGQYVTGEIATHDMSQVTQWAQLRETYAGMQSWCKTGNNSWHTVAACDIGRGRWESVFENIVPESVRMAEMLR
ncbi:hypothetical protein HOT57_gp40 [Pseudomonas phage phCDa]|uniref:Uncharacterized protein n=1 Tax=Pseudomonas phage phCDa TaxID=2268587 RepID=A0A2Z5H937_9CAUD|nr:hypothetical protein HOT57_gp40 [Pseudomonas phage phCDa]AXC36484.1 hypothetical protein phCDa_40 [Pseudomonas phage phCDa]